MTLQPSSLPPHRGLSTSPYAFWLLPLCLGIALALIGYGILPWVGIGAFESLFSLENFFLLLLLVIGAVGYVYYFKSVLKHPQALLYFLVAGWPLLEFFNQMLLDYAGLNLHLRPILFMVIGVPTVWLGIRDFKALWRFTPHLKYYAGFWIILFLYFLFNNSHATVPRMGTENAVLAGSLDVTQFVGYTYCAIGIVIAALTLLRHHNPRRLFDTLNIVLLSVSSIEALVTIIGYPFGAFSMVLDGFHRAFGVFTHPNPFAHHMGILLIYLVGLFFYYQGAYKRRIPVWLLLGGILLNLIAFLLGLSKTAIAVFMLCAFALFAFNLVTSTHGRKAMLQGMLLVLLFVPVGLWIFELITEQSFFTILQARIEQATSFNWRMDIWNLLVANMDAGSLLVGHGFTAANAWILQLTYHNLQNIRPLMMVHNGYLALLYDLGILGLLLFVAVGSVLMHTWKHLRNPFRRMNRPLLATILALGLYFLIVCGFDELTYMFDAAHLYWILTTILYTVALREAT